METENEQALQPAKQKWETTAESTEKKTRPWDLRQIQSAGLPPPDAINFMMALADKIVGGALCTSDLTKFSGPAALQQDLGMTLKDVVKANAMAKMFAGYELGIGAIEALRTVQIVKGRVMVHYAKLLDIMLSRGLKVVWNRQDEEEASLTITRPDTGYTYTATWNMAKAKQAGLDRSYDSGEPNQYQKRPGVMFCARCASECYRMSGTGPLLYTYEEKEELERDEEDDKRIARIGHGGTDEFRVAVKARKSEPAPPPTAAAPPEPVKPPEPVTTAQAPESALVNTTVTYTLGVLVPSDGKREPRVLESKGGPVFDTLSRAEDNAREWANRDQCDYAILPSSGETIGPYRPTVAPQAPVPPPDSAPPEPAPEPAKATPAPQDGELEALRQQMNSRVSEIANNMGVVLKTATARFKAFFAGYLGVSLRELPKDPRQFSEALDELESTIYNQPEVFKLNPENAGILARRNVNELRDFLTKEWSSTPETIPLGLKLRRQWGLSFKEFAGKDGWLEANGLDFMSGIDVRAYIRTALVTREAFKLQKITKATGIPVHEIVSTIESQLGKPLEECDKAELDKALLNFRVVAPAAPAPLPPPPPPPPVEELPDVPIPDGEEVEQGGLFSDWES
jgi:hypothetical protein